MPWSSRWFSRQRGTAVSVLGSASMTGMSLLVPVMAWMILTVGWRMTYVAIGLFVLVCLVPMCLFVVRDSPESMGLGPDGDPIPEGHTAATVLERTPVGEAVRTLAFWQLAGTFMTCGFSMSLISSHGVPMLTDHGYAPVFASTVLGILGGSSILTTMMLGAASDRFGRRPVLASIYAGRSLVFAGFFLIRDNSDGDDRHRPHRRHHDRGDHVHDVRAHRRHLRALTRWAASSASSSSPTRWARRPGSWLGGALFDSTGGYGAAFAIAGTVLVAASVVSLHIDDGSRSVPWLPRPAQRRRLKKAHLLRWRPRLHAQRRETTPRVQPSGAASHLDLFEPPATFCVLVKRSGSRASTWRWRRRRRGGRSR